MSNEFQLGLFDAVPEAEHALPDTTQPEVSCAPEAPTDAPASSRQAVLLDGYSEVFSQAIQGALSEGLSALIAHGELIPSFGSVGRNGNVEGAIFYVSKREFEPEMLNDTYADFKYLQETYIPIEATIEDNQFTIIADGLYDTLGDERFTKVLLSACKIINEQAIDLSTPDFAKLHDTITDRVNVYKEELKRDRDAKNSKNDQASPTISA